ncbi:MAG: TrkA C-terminal domain-containing protein, partial [Pseudomonadota bacterium]
MELLTKLFEAAPLLALFITVGLGYIVGKFKVGRFVLGGIAGTLLVGVLIGQLGIKLDPGVKSIFFALFIYAVGYQGGPQFFQSINKQTINQLISAFVMCFVGLLCVLAAALMFDLDRGTAAGLAAGGLTQSAILGTAGDAIAKLDLSPEQIKTMQTNVAVGYAVTYIFGSLGPIIVATWFIPMVMGWDIRAEAVKLAQSISGGRPELDPGQFDAIKRVATRCYKVTASAKAKGKTVSAAQNGLSDAKIEAIFRSGKEIDVTDQTKIAAGDIVAVTGVIADISKTEGYLGTEVQAPPEFQLVEEVREIILTNRQAAGHTIHEINEHVSTDLRRGIYAMRIRRAGHDLPLLPGLQLHLGDELHVVGTPKDLDRVESKIGYKIPAGAFTDFIFFGFGMALGILLGMGSVKLAGVPVTLGTGGG